MREHSRNISAGRLPTARPPPIHLPISLPACSFPMQAIHALGQCHVQVLHQLLESARHLTSKHCLEDMFVLCKLIDIPLDMLCDMEKLRFSLYLDILRIYWYIFGTYLVAGGYVVGMWMVRGWYVVGTWLVHGWYVDSTPNWTKRVP